MLTENLTSFLTNPYLIAGGAMLLAYWASSRLQPVIILLSQEKNLMDEPEARSSHSYRVPTYGGAGIFIVVSVLVMSLVCLVGIGDGTLSNILALMAAISILFFLGIKDDMIGLDPTKKFIGQLLAAFIVIVLADVRIESLEGIFGVGQLPYWVSIVFTFFVFLLVINAYNLIDGIDGLAGSVALVASLVFGAFFLFAGNIALSIVSFVLAGALIGFLKYNLSHATKIFMGDSGSLFIGFLLAYQAVSFLKVNADAAAEPILSNAPVIVLTILAFPLLDTLRVFMLRAFKGHSPFSPDRNHLHHRLLDLGLSHGHATLLIVLKTVLLIAVCWKMQDIPIHLHLICMLIMGFALFLGPLVLKKNKAMSPVNPIYEKKADDAQTKSPQSQPNALVRPPYQTEKRNKSIPETAATGD
ncbi:MraY family glycosyltransferase [Robiginitalea aurantiaca]|uniref:MraY family glycosyltransferase n=1 Tax=Robiginitalea aurantiaca TaxID=3056915 RepID=A0ABT7WE11_9FLAO|nr:MraY family glycosyltransferase [Robiginitalea aurantiaca]MDM9631158.1 MraY family glycosyltransferase [Robiginitalea aurantiaca]